MRLFSRLVLGLPLLTVLALASGCKQAGPGSGKALLFPALAERQGELDRLQLRGAGDSVLVTLARKNGLWRVAERGDWPADPGRVSQYLFVLSQAHRLEEKTSNPALYSRLGVEPITGAQAAGAELILSGTGISMRLLIGDEHPKLDSNYVRINGQPRAWLTDLPVSFERNPASWLDRRLVDLPLARIARVRVSGAAAKAFTLSHRDDRFRVDEVPSAAMRDSYQADTLAGVLDQLQFEDLAADDGTARTERELQFLAVDGAQLKLQAWQVAGQLWLRASASVDEDQAAAWARQAVGDQATSQPARKLVASLNQRFHSRRFLMPANVAATLMLSQEEILAGAPGT